MRFLTYFIVSLVMIILSSCAEAGAKESKSRSNAFDKVDKRDKKLFTQKERIESYNKSINKSESFEKSFNNNISNGYSGYGSAKSSGKNESDKKIKKNKVAKPKFSNAGFSAYSTN